MNYLSPDQFLGRLTEATRRATPKRRTDPVAFVPDDPAIWIHPTDPAQSLILGTDKGPHASTDESRDGALYVFDLDGSIIEEKCAGGLGRPNNVDVEYGLELGGSRVDIAVVTERYLKRLRVYALPGMEAIDGGGIPVFEQQQHRAPMGVALYRRQLDGTVYAIVSRKTGPLDGYMWQYRLEDRGDGTVGGVKVREFGEWSGKKEIEALVVDDALGYVYVADESAGIRKYHADPDAPNADGQLVLFGREEFGEDQEGMSIYEVTESTGYILVSDQAADAFHVFPRQGVPGDPHAHPRMASIRLSTRMCDGNEVTSRLQHEAYPGGLFVAMSDDRTFHLYSWEQIARRHRFDIAAR